MRRKSISKDALITTKTELLKKYPGSSYQGSTRTLFIPGELFRTAQHLDYALRSSKYGYDSINLEPC